MLIRKHFERLAQVFRVNYPIEHQRRTVGSSDWRRVKKLDDAWSIDQCAAVLGRRQVMWRDLVDAMCVELKAINPRFDEDKFRKACDPNG